MAGRNTLAEGPVNFIHIRPAKAVDAPGLARVEVDAWRDTYPDVLPASYLTKTLEVPLCEARWQRRIRRERAWPPLVALTGQSLSSMPQRIAAYATFGPTRLPNLPFAVELFELYVHPEAQGQGIGKRLCAAGAERVYRKGYDSICVEVLEQNANRFFYESLGAHLVARREHPFAGKTLPACIYGWTDIRTLARPRIRKPAA
ncbi:MAG: N-acetyltransferase [Rhodospirillales bacterium]